MNEVLDHLYTTFAQYHVGNDFTGCECCVNSARSGELATTPLRSLKHRQLEHYARKAISTWGNVRHFKYFLPRLMELVIAQRHLQLDPIVVFGKLHDAKFTSWPQRERDALDRFFEACWTRTLETPAETTHDNSSEVMLCAFALALPSLQRFLDVWTTNPAISSKHHLAGFLIDNHDSLITKGRLLSHFWDTSGKPHREVIHWLQSEALFDRIHETGISELEGELATARALLVNIRRFLQPNLKDSHS